MSNNTVKTYLSKVIISESKVMIYFREMLMEYHQIDFLKLIVSFVFGLQQDEQEIKQIEKKKKLIDKKRS